MPYDVSAIGPLNIDLLVRGAGPPNWEAIPTWDGPADMEMAAAGSVGYTVQDFARLGLRTQVCSCLPDDPLGVFVRTTVEQAGVDTGLVEQVPGTLVGIGVYMLLFGSRKRPLSYRLPTHPLWQTAYAEATIERLLDARLLHNGGYLHHQDAWHGALTDIYRRARQRGLITSIDPQFPLFAMQPPWMTALDDVLPYVDILLCDEHEARNLTALAVLDTAAQRLLDAGAGCVVIKQGEDGSTIYTRDQRHHQVAVSFGEMIDTIGAGDAYDAAFLYGMLQGWSHQRCALFGSIVAGHTVTGVGGSQTMPDVETALATLKRMEH